MTVEQLYESQPFDFTTRDGLMLHGTRYVSKSPHTILFLHGASGHSSQLNKSIGMIREATGGEIFTYDHRGHGSSPGARGDLDHVDQYVEDVADVLKIVKGLKPNGRIILAGHSMGGGIIQRYAMSHEAKLADAYLLFAPVLGMGLPGEIMPPSIQPHQSRFLGLFMLNAVGVKRFNHLPAMNFGFAEFNGHINQYTFTAAISVRPDNYQKGIAALQKPALVILGGNDTATGVTADIAAAAIREYSHAEVVVIQGERHHVQNSPNAVAKVADWMRKLYEQN